MSNNFAFNLQNESYNCSENSLMNALLVLGIVISAKDAHEIVKSSQEAETPLVSDINKGLEQYSCRVEEVLCNDEASLKKLIERQLAMKHTLVICTDQFHHYSMLAGKTIDDRYIWIDSSGPTIVGSSTWPQIEEWMNSGDPDEKYYFLVIESGHPENPIVDVQALRQIYLEKPSLISNWGKYMGELLDIFIPSDSGIQGMPAVEFLENNGGNIIESLQGMYAYTDLGKLGEILKSYKTIAELHQLTVSMDEARALVRLTIALSLHALDVE